MSSDSLRIQVSAQGVDFTREVPGGSIDCVMYRRTVLYSGVRAHLQPSTLMGTPRFGKEDCLVKRILPFFWIIREVLLHARG